MIASVLVVLLGAILYFFMEKKNTYYKHITMYLISISLILLTIIAYTSKLSTTFLNTLEFDFLLLNAFSKIRLHVQHLSRFFNIAVALFMLISFVMLLKITRLNRCWLFLYGILLAAFSLCNDFEFTRYVRLALHTAATASEAEFYTSLIAVCKTFTNTLFIGSVSAPIVVLCIQSVRNKIFLNRKYNLSLTAVLCIFHGFVCFILYQMYDAIWLTNVDFSKVPAQYQVSRGHFTVPILFLVLFILVTVISFQLKPINTFSVITTGKWIEQNKTLSSNVGMTIHTYKNAFIALRQQIELLYVYLAKENFDQVKNHLDISNHIIANQLDSISKNLKNLGGGKSSTEFVDLAECIQSTLRNLTFEQSTLETKLSSDCIVMGNYDNLCEVFTNVLYNAEYALKNRENPTIRITLFQEDDFCEVDIWDNGCGIPRQNLKKIFNPFFSTKPALSFGGLGLNFVDTTIKAHHGDVRVKSQENEYTLIKIVLPLCGKTKEWRKEHEQNKIGAL